MIENEHQYIAHGVGEVFLLIIFLFSLNTAMCDETNLYIMGSLSLKPFFSSCSRIINQHIWGSWGLSACDQGFYRHIQTHPLGALRTSG